MRLEIGTRIGPYEVVAPLGRGGMGEVFRCRDTRLKRDVAIKVLPANVGHDPARLAEFQLEAQTLASIHHRNIATIFGIEEHDGTLALVIEFVPGRTLDDRLLRGPLPLEDTLAITAQIAEALEAAHERGIVHRDLKPANVMLAEDGTAKVLDFGLATVTRGVEAAESVAAVTTRGVIVTGTPAYMSPEQAKGGRTDERTDVWAFGCLLFETLTGQRVFGRETIAETLSAVLTAPTDWSLLPPDTPDPIRRLLRRCLQRAPHDRLRDMGDARLELQEVLDELRSGHLATPHSPSATRAASMSSATTPLVATLYVGSHLAVAAIALIAVAFAAGSLLNRDRPPAPAVTRLSVLPTPRLEFGEFTPEPYPAVSPDGERVAFVANAPDARAQLFVQRLDEFQPRPIQSAVGAQWPFWSPDGRYLGYFAEGQLRVVPAAGGPARTVVPVVTGFGGAWNAAGTILFGTNDGIMRVPAAGGTPGIALPRPAGAPARPQRFPAFLPDGDHFLFAQLSDDHEHSGIYAASLRDATPKRLIDVVNNPVFDEQGYVLYVRDNALFAHHFDPATLTLSGDPLTIDTPVEGGGSVRYAPISAAGHTLAFRTANYARSQLVVMDRAGAPVQSVGPEGTYLSPSISPAGDRLAVSRLDPSTGDLQMWDMSVLRNTAGRLSSGRAIELQPVWSPDGQRLLYSSMRAGTFSISERNFSTGENRVVLQLPSRLFPSGWLPDGSGILYTEEAGSGPEGDVWEYKLDGSKPRPLVRTNADETHGRVSPDGRWLAYASNDSGRWNVYVVPRAGGGRAIVSTAGGSNPLWHMDSRELFYVEYDERTRSSLAIDAVLKSVRLDGAAASLSTPATLFRVRVPVYSLYEVWVYSALPTGERFVFNRVTDEAQSGLNITRNWVPPQP